MRKQKRGINAKDFSIRFMLHSDIKNLSSLERVDKILSIAKKNQIIILQGKLRPQEETMLIQEAMSLINRLKNFKGIELAVVSSEETTTIFSKLKQVFINVLAKTDLSTITIIGPAAIVKEIKRDPKKIELFLNR